jgi:hypothetical protein
MLLSNIRIPCSNNSFSQCVPRPAATVTLVDLVKIQTQAFRIRINYGIRNSREEPKKYVF